MSTHSCCCLSSSCFFPCGFSSVRVCPLVPSSGRVRRPDGAVRTLRGTPMVLRKSEQRHGATSQRWRLSYSILYASKENSKERCKKKKKEKEEKRKRKNTSGKARTASGRVFPIAEASIERSKRSVFVYKSLMCSTFALSAVSSPRTSFGVGCFFEISLDCCNLSWVEAAASFLSVSERTERCISPARSGTQRPVCELWKKRMYVKANKWANK